MFTNGIWKLWTKQPVNLLSLLLHQYSTGSLTISFLLTILMNDVVRDVAKRKKYPSQFETNLLLRFWKGDQTLKYDLYFYDTIYHLQSFIKLNYVNISWREWSTSCFLDDLTRASPRPREGEGQSRELDDHSWRLVPAGGGGVDRYDDLHHEVQHPAPSPHPVPYG